MPHCASPRRRGIRHRMVDAGSHGRETERVRRPLCGLRAVDRRRSGTARSAGLPGLEQRRSGCGRGRHRKARSLPRVVAQVPLLDLLRAGWFALVMEFGDPQNAADAPVLASYSPYHNVRDVSYPAVLLDAGENDPRCPPWHARKMAARLQSATRSGHPVLLRVWKESGHIGSSTAMQIDQSADWLAFVRREPGMASAGL